MTAQVLLNLLNKLGKNDKMGGLPSVLSPLATIFNTFVNTRAHLPFDIKITLKSHF